MQSGRYNIKSPTVALSYESDGTLEVRTVPAGTVITIEKPGTEDDRLIDVIWNGKRVMMFTRDLQSRAELDEASH